MPISPTVTMPVFLTNLVSAAMVGPGASQLATGLANGMFTYASAGMKVQTVDVGTAGVGKGTGIAVLTPASLIPTISSFVAGHGIIGIFSQPMAVAIANAMSQCFSLAIVNTLSPSVGVGAGVGTIIPTSGIPYFIAGFKSAGMVGAQTENLAMAIAQGLDAALPTTVVTVAIVGSPSIVPSSGVGSGIVS